MFAFFDFDNTFCNMYRSDKFYARTDCNKFSTTKLTAEFNNYHDNIARVHRGNDIDTDNGQIKNTVLPTVAYSEHVNNLL